MRILHTIHSADPRSGGPIEAVRQLSLVHKTLGHTMEVASLDDPSAEFVAKSLDFPIHALGPGRTHYGYSSRFIPWLRENESRFDAFVVHGLWQFHGFATRSALAGKRPYFVYPHGMLDPYFKRAYPLKHLKKWLFWPWGDYRVLRDAKSVFFTCEEERLLARKSFWLYRCQETVAGLGTAEPPTDVEEQRRAFLAAVPQVANRRFLLFLGRIHVKKGCDLLIEAFAKAAAGTDRLLVMAGPDQTGWKADLVRRATELGVADRIVWPGMLSGATKWGAFRCAEAFVLSSHQENFGLAVAEALAAGCPVLISNKVNIWREIESDRAGLVGDDTVDSTHAVLSQWLALDSKARTDYRERARSCFQNRFEIGHVARHTLDLLQAT
jgi:glycosyltransferase involved in cell wall biosynthesis